MDSLEPSGQASSLDSLRTVEFRQTLRGYHIDDVDEYLERVAVEAEALQEQFRQTTDRLHQATDRIGTLEQQMQNVRTQQPEPIPEISSDDTLQRTLLLAQKFVDQTQAEAEDKANALVHDAEVRARTLLAEAEDRARKKHDEADRQLRDEVSRLEGIRSQLAGEVDSIARHLDGERSRLRGALTEILQWVDDNVQPAPSMLTQRSGQTTRSAAPQIDRSASDRNNANQGAGSPPRGTIPGLGTGPSSSGPVRGDDQLGAGEPTGSLFNQEPATRQTPTVR